MKRKDRNELRAAAYLLGIANAAGEPIERDASENHDWSKFLLAKDMYPRGGYEGPDWVPFSLWEATNNRRHDYAETLINSPGARELWANIEQTYDEPNSIAIQLPMEIALAKDRWKLHSKRKPAEHKKQMLRMKANAIAIANEIDRLESLDHLGSGERFDFMRMYSEADREIVYQAVARYTLRNNSRSLKERGLDGKTLADYLAPPDRTKPPSPINVPQAARDAAEFWELLHGDDEQWPGIVPSLAKLMRSLAGYFESEANRPELKRPAFKNAERNFFANHLCTFFRNSFGFASPSIISRIVCMFFRQGITDNEVSQMIAKLPPPT